MKNIRVLYLDVPKKGTRDYAVLFEHDGLKLRQDFEISLDEFEKIGITEVYDIMIEMLEQDLAETEYMDQIRERQAMGLTKIEGVVEKYLAEGFQDDPESDLFNDLAVARLGA